MKKFLSLLLLSSVILLGCVQNTMQEYMPTPNTTETPIITPKQIVMPPPAIMTPLPPEFHVREFVRYFNERNATELYELFSERVKLNHSIEELEDALKFAEEFNITIVKWKIVSNRFSPKNTIVNLMIIKNDVVINKTITVPFVYKSYKTCEKIIINGKLVNHTIIHSVGYIDRWLIEDIIN